MNRLAFENDTEPCEEYYIRAIKLFGLRYQCTTGGDLAHLLKKMYDLPDKELFHNAREWLIDYEYISVYKAEEEKFHLFKFYTYRKNTNLVYFLSMNRNYYAKMERLTPIPKQFEARLRDDFIGTLVSQKNIDDGWLDKNRMDNICKHFHNKSGDFKQITLEEARTKMLSYWEAL